MADARPDAQDLVRGDARADAAAADDHASVSVSRRDSLRDRHCEVGIVVLGVVFVGADVVHVVAERLEVLAERALELISPVVAADNDSQFSYTCPLACGLPVHDITT